jgi:hypothetical protein
VLGHVEEPERGGRAVVVAEPRHAGDDVHVQVEVQRALGEEHDVRLVAPDDVSQRRARRTQDRAERSGLALGQIVEGPGLPAGRDDEPARQRAPSVRDAPGVVHVETFP